MQWLKFLTYYLTYFNFSYKTFQPLLRLSQYQTPHGLMQWLISLQRKDSTVRRVGNLHYIKMQLTELHKYIKTFHHITLCVIKNLEKLSCWY